MSKPIIVKTTDTLLNYLVNNETGYNRTKLKSLLKNECISVNKKVTTQFNYPLKENDHIEIVSYNKKAGLSFDIIYEDDDIIVINKVSGILSVPFENEDKETAYDLVNDYVMKTNSKARVHIVHRLDLGTSGVLMFAKDEKIKKQYQDKWNELATSRVYIAQVEGVMRKDKDTIITKLNTDKKSNVHSSSKGKQAITHYEVIERRKDSTLVKVNIETGRQNQIRVHLKEVGHPIVGDKKYGAKTNPIKRIGLHAYQLKIKHPTTKKLQSFTAPIPKVFRIKKVK
ncbi:MAG: RNA pseudouridine synthase [Erysipelothrix sp.]|nr:RNA pseudouridine synthase [Erysipelothrix sp.]